jgi:hypothetical protein
VRGIPRGDVRLSAGETSTATPRPDGLLRPGGPSGGPLGRTAQGAWR